MSSVPALEQYQSVDTNFDPPEILLDSISKDTIPGT